MECQSRATVKLSASFQEYSLTCEHGSSVLKKGGSTPQEFLLFISSPKFEDGATVILIGKDGDDEALMLEVGEDDVHWTAFVIEEAVSFTVEFADSSTPSPFFLCAKQLDGGIYKYICVSSENTLYLSATSPDIISFDVIQLFEAGPDSGNDTEIKEKASTTLAEVTCGDMSCSTSVDGREQAACYHSGTLFKKGDDMLGSWKKRHFVALNAPGLFRIEYFDKEGGVKKGTIDLTGFQAMASPVDEEKWGLLLVPGVNSPVQEGRSRSKSKVSSSGRIYRLKAESAAAQTEWLHVFARACAKSTSLACVMEGQQQPQQGDASSSSPPLLTADSLSESSAQLRSRSRTDSTGSLSITLPPSSSPLYPYLFGEGPLGMTLKRRSSGVIYIATVEEGTQASRHGLTPGATLWSIGSKVVGGTVVDKEGWGELVAFIKQTPRPVEIVFQKYPSGVEVGPRACNQQQQQGEDCSSTKSAYSLLDYPTSAPDNCNDVPRGRPPSPSTPLSLLSVPSSSSGSHLSEEVSVSEGGSSDYSRCNSDTNMTESSSSVVHVGLHTHQCMEHTQSQKQKQKETDGQNNDGSEEEQVQELEHDIERSIVEDLSKRLIFKNKSVDGSSATPAAGKSWRSSILGNGGGGSKGTRQTKPTFQLVKDGRRLAFEGPLLLLAKRALWQVKIPKMLFLFNDILLVTVPTAGGSAATGGGAGGGEYSVEQIIDLGTCKVSCRLSPTHEMVDGQVEAGQQPLLWELLHPSGSMVFLCPSLEKQQQWVQHMAHCICEHVSALNGSSAALGVGWRHQYLLGTMHAAVFQRDQALVVALLESFAAGHLEEEALEGADEDGYTPLHYACILRLTEIVRLLQESSADVTAQDRRGLTPLHWSALQLDAPSLECLCMNLMDVDLEDNKGRTPLYLACVEGRAANGRSDPSALLACVTTLLTFGAHPDRQDREGLCILHFLSAQWQYPVVDLLLDGIDNPLSTGQHTHIADVNIFDEGEGWTALHYACSSNSLQRSIGEGHMILQSVLTDPSSPGEATGSGGGSSVSSSAASGAGLRTVLSLLEHGALPNITTFLGHTPLSLLAAATTPRDSPSSDHDSSMGRWAGAYDSAIVMLLSNGARLSFLHPSTHIASSEIPHHWANPAVKQALEEGAAVWAKKDQLDGDVANLRLKCYEQRKCVNALITSDLRQLAARMSESPHSSASSSGGGASGAPPCLLCLTPFSMFRRQHHCRLCDALCCDECSRKRVLVEKSPVRVCDTCYCLAKRKVDTVLTEQFFAGQGAQQSQINSKTELFKGAQSPNSSSSTGKTSGTIGSTMATMEDTKLQLQERGEKLANLGDKSEKLANASNEFANMAKLLKEQNKSSWW